MGFTRWQWYYNKTQHTNEGRSRKTSRRNGTQTVRGRKVREEGKDRDEGIGKEGRRERGEEKKKRQR
jgi:hypothetical protein